MVFIALTVWLAAFGNGIADSLPSPEPAGGATAKEPVEAERQMVVAANPLAAQAGLEILRAGGSAVDAAVTAQLVLNLVEPQSSGIGGGGFLLHYDAAEAILAAYDGRETAPAAATADMFLDADGKPLEFFDAVVGGLSVGTPGVLRLLEAAHRAHGRLPWARLFEPAIALAEQGFAVSPRLHALLAADEHLPHSPTARGYFYGADGAPLPAGAVLRNPAFAETLRAIAAGGADAFYGGPIAADIAAAVQTALPRPGRLTLDDLAAYRAKERAPVCLAISIRRICGMPPPSSGGIAVLQILGLLDRIESSIAEKGDSLLHFILEASRLAFADRDRYIADPDFVDVPLAELLSDGYLRRRASLITPDRSLGKATPGELEQKAGWALPVPQFEPVSTSHISIVDAAGNAVSFTSSIENAFGARLMVRGFLLNNQLTDFAFQPQRDGRPVANRVEPGKRPRSSMAPAMVFEEDGRLGLVVGSPGGSSIIGYVVKTLLAVLLLEDDPQAAVDSPNFVNRNGATELEAGRGLEDVGNDLVARGHEVKYVEMTSGLHAILVTPDGLQGGADSRREGVAAGD